jgi:hypothetical protein
MALKSFYPLYTDLTDSVGGNTGSGSPSYAAIGPAPGSALFSSKRVTATASAITGNWTMSFEAIRTAACNNNGSIYEVGTVGGSGFGVIVWSDDGAFGIPNGATNWWVNNLHQGSADYIATNVQLVINVVSECLYSYDGSNVDSWLNGDLKSTIAFTTNPSSATTCCIGDRQGAAGNYYNGRLSRAYTANTATARADAKNQFAGRRGFF